MEEHPLQIKTDSVTGSGDVICLVVYDKTASRVGSFTNMGWLTILFSKPMKYLLGSCMEHNSYKANTLFQNEPPIEQNKIWTISKTSTHLLVNVNGVMVLNFEFATAQLTYSCQTNWIKDVNRIVFWGAGDADDDTASDQYRELPLAGKFRVN